jgi:hypothetical protein
MTTQAVLDDRYGRTRSPRRRIVQWSIVGVVAVGLTVALGWVTVSNTLGSVSTTDTGFTVADAEHVTISFQISAPVGQPVACALEAQDEDHGTVGWRVVEYPASPDHTQAFSEEIPTVALATTGFVNSCWVP